MPRKRRKYAPLALLLPALFFGPFANAVCEVYPVLDDSFEQQTAVDPQTSTETLLDPVFLSNFNMHYYRPGHAAPAAGFPLIVAWHGAAGPGNANNAALILRDDWINLAERHGFVVATQVATGASGGWLPNTAERRLHLIVDDAEARFSIDSNRIFTWGFSAGGHVLHEIMLGRGQRFAAYAVRAGVLAAVAGPNALPQAHRMIAAHLSVGSQDSLKPFVLQDYADFQFYGWVAGQDVVYHETPGGHFYGPVELQAAYLFLCEQ